MTITASSETLGRYGEHKLWEALAEVCAAAGLESRGARLIRLVNNAIFQLADQPVIVRLVLSPSMAYRADNAVRAATILAEHNVPAVRLLPGLAQPVRAGDHVATFWHVAQEIRPADGNDLALLLKRLHSVSVPLEQLLPWDPMADAHRRLVDAEEISHADRRFFEQWIERLTVQLSTMETFLPPGLIHGDAHINNVIVTPDGPLLCDLDQVCFGPREWDLAIAAVGKIRFGDSAGDYQKLVAGYGVDVTQWPGFSILRQARELKLTTGGLSVVRTKPEVRPELHKRMRSIRLGDTTARWAKYR